MNIALLLFRALSMLLPTSYTQAQRADAIALTTALVAEAHAHQGWLAAVRVMSAALFDLIGQIVWAWLHPVGRFMFSAGSVRDLQHGFRMMGTRPGHSAAIILTLALGIGLNAAVFSVVDWVLLRPLPYPEPDSLVRVWMADKTSPDSVADLTYSEVKTFATATSLRAAAAFSAVTRVLRAPGLDPAHVTVARVTGDVFAVLGAYPSVGRAFDAGELKAGSRVAVVSHALWRNRFGANAGIVGRVITLDAEPHTVVGVMPPGRGYPRDADIWRPSTAEEREDDDGENVMIARLARDSDDAGATAELTTLQRAPNRAVWVERLHASEVRDVRAVLMWVLVAAGLVLAVAAANVAALIGTRALDRAGELAVRGALGASGGELARQLLVEGVLLAIAGGALGVIVGAGALRLLVTFAPAGLPRIDEIALDTRVLGVSAIVMLLVGVAVSIAPAWRASLTDLTTTLNGFAASRTTERVAPRRVLVAAQVAIAVVLTIGAALLARSLRHLVTLDHGFDPSRVVAMSLNVRGMTPDQARSLFITLADEAAAIPGASSAAVTFRLPTEVVGLRAPLRVDGAANARPALVALRVITPRYFETVGIPILAGRSLAESDARQHPRVGVVNRAFVREVLDDGGAIDRRLTGELVEGGVTIVGVAGDVTPGSVPDRPALYVSYDQFAINAGSLVVKATENPSTLIPVLRARIQTAAPALPLDRIQTLDDVLATGRSVARFNALVASSFGILAFVLAMIGVYGLTSREVSTRRRESGVRAALGASHATVMWQLLRPIFALTASGLVAGVVLALGAGASLRSLLSGVSPVDPATFVAVAVVVAATAAMAACVAAWRVARDPAAALRGIMTL